MSTERASKPSCRLSGMSAYLERKLGKFKDGIRDGIHKKVDNLRNSFGHYEHPDSYNDVGSFPVPTSPNNFYNTALGPLPEPAPPQGYRPQRSDLYEASGSNHTSNPNSDYFDSMNPEEYRLHHQIPNYEEFRPYHSLGDQLAGLLQNDLLLDTPTSHYHSQPEFDPVTENINDPEVVLWSDASDQHQTGNYTTSTTLQNGWMMPGAMHQTGNYTTSTTLQNGWMMPGAMHQTENHTTSSTDQYGLMMPGAEHQTENHTTSTTDQYGWTMPGDKHQTENNRTSTTFQTYESMMTGDTGESRESMMDTGASNFNKYILDPVAEEAPPATVIRKFNDIYVDLRRILRGDPEGARGSSGRRGRGFRIMGRILCIAIRLKGSLRILRRMRKRPPPGQNRGQCSRQQQCRKRIRTGGLGSVISDQSGSSKYKGVTYRNGKWIAETRVSNTPKKVWLGTFDTEKKAALAADAGMHHCSAKKKKFNFPDFVKYLGPSQYQDVQTLCLAGRKKEAKAKVARLANTHADTFAHLC